MAAARAGRAATARRRRARAAPASIALLAAAVSVGVLMAAAAAPAAGRAGREGGWTAALDEALERAVRARVTPGAVGLVGSGAGGWLYARAVGRGTYGDAGAAVSVEGSQFDLASLSKVVATTAAVARLYEEGRLALDGSVASVLGGAFAAGGKAGVTVRHCLLHKAGFPPDPEPDYWSAAFGCPQARDVYAEPLSFACSARIYASLLAQPLDAAPGARYVYSDLSFITLMYVVGRVALRDGLVRPAWMRAACGASGEADGAALQCAFEAYYREVVLARLDGVCSRGGRGGCGMRHTAYLPRAAAAARALPTSVPRVMPAAGRPLRGVVEDGNAAAMGGIAGHAGVFSRAGDLANYALAWLRPPAAGGFLNATTVALFRTVDDDAGEGASSRALGWNTNDPRAADYGWDLSCGALSAETFTHVGYTGTQICIDPRRDVYTVLLTNRVFPVDEADSGIHDLRAAFNSIVAAGVGGGPPASAGRA